MTKNIFKKFGVRCLVTTLLALLVVQQVALAEKKSLREIEDKRYEVVDIPLSPWPYSDAGFDKQYFPNFYGFWLSNTQFVMSVLQDVPDAYARKLERIVLIDAATGAYRVLVEQGSVNCRSQKLKVMAYLPFHESHYYKLWPKQTSGGTPAERRRRTEERSAKISAEHRFIKLDDDGVVSPLEGPSPIESNCAPAGYPVDIGFWVGKALREDDGYIDISERDNRETLTLGTAKLVRPGQAPIELGFPTAAVSFPTYLPYYDKYLMSTSDYAGAGGNSRSSMGAFWKYPYDISPSWLVSREGEVQAVPYPEIIREYGMVGFTLHWPTPRGILINDRGGVFAGKGLLLLQGEKLLRIWGGPPSLNFFQDNRGRTEASYVLNISPDACRIVFTHAKKFPKAGDQNPDAVPLSILNICKDR